MVSDAVNDDSHFLKSLGAELTNIGKTYYGYRCDEIAARLEAALAELRAANGYMKNAAIDLATGAPKKTAMDTINGGIRRLETFLGPAKD